MAYNPIDIAESNNQTTYEDIEAGGSSGITISGGVKINAGVTVGTVKNLQKGTKKTDKYGYSKIIKPSELE